MSLGPKRRPGRAPTDVDVRQIPTGMEPTGIEPVTSCLQSRTCTPRFPTICLTSAENYDGASESITTNTHSDGSEQTQKQTQVRLGRHRAGSQDHEATVEGDLKALSAT